jgi:hypothetical protein
VTCALQSFFTLRLDVARELRNAPRFFYPHNLDFRGRAYPMHPYLNHMGDDVSRGLMTFAEARPLGPRGLDWMLAHVANMWGQGEDKLSNDERREFARTHMAQVRRRRAFRVWITLFPEVTLPPSVVGLSFYPVPALHPPSLPRQSIALPAPRCHAFFSHDCYPL